MEMWLCLTCNNYGVHDLDPGLTYTRGQRDTYLCLTCRTQTTHEYREMPLPNQPMPHPAPHRPASASASASSSASTSGSHTSVEELQQRILFLTSENKQLCERVAKVHMGTWVGCLVVVSVRDGYNTDRIIWWRWRGWG